MQQDTSPTLPHSVMLTCRCERREPRAPFLAQGHAQCSTKTSGSSAQVCCHGPLPDARVRTQHVAKYVWLSSSHSPSCPRSWHLVAPPGTGQAHCSCSIEASGVSGFHCRPYDDGPPSLRKSGSKLKDRPKALRDQAADHLSLASSCGCTWRPGDQATPSNGRATSDQNAELAFGFG